MEWRSFIGKSWDKSERKSPLVFFTSHPFTVGEVGGGGGVRGGKKGRRRKIKREGRGGRKKEDKSKCIGFHFSGLHFSFSPTLFLLEKNVLTSLKEKCQTFRIHTSKKSHCYLLFSTLKFPSGC